MSGLSHLFLVVRMRVFSIFTYHSTRPNNDKNTPVMAVMTTIPKIAIDQKISFRFFLLFSISCCFCDCFLISLWRAFSLMCRRSASEWDLVPLRWLLLLFFSIYCCSFFSLIEGVALGRHPRPPNWSLRIFRWVRNFLLSVIRMSFSSFWIP